MLRWVAVVSLLLSLGACGSSALEPVITGVRIDGAKGATWSADGPARQAVFSRDGRLAAMSDASGRITVRETAGWNVVERLTHPGGATSVAFSGDGSHLYSAGYDATIREWDLPHHHLVRILADPHGTVWTIDVSPEGKRLAASGEDAIVRIWALDRPAAPVELRGHTRNVWQVDFSPDSKTLASGSFDNSVRLWDAGSGKALRTLNGHTQAIVGLDFSPDGKSLATGSDDSTVRLWRVADGAPLRTIDNGTHVDTVAFSPDGRWLASGGHPRGTIGELWHGLAGGGSEGPAVRVWRTSDAALVAVLPHPDDVIRLAFSPDGRTLLTSGEDNHFRLWRLRLVKP
jgi:WD40 repeat protein